jgi:hypothetical protein
LLQEEADDIIKRASECEDFAKRGFVSTDHFKIGAGGNACGNTGPACHCAYFASKKVDRGVALPHPDGAECCGHIHSHGCKECEQLPEFRLRLDMLIAKVKALGGSTGQPTAEPQPTTDDPTVDTFPIVQPQPTTDQPTADTFPIVQPQPTTDQPTADTFPTAEPQPTTDQPTADTFPIVQPQPTTDQPTADTFPIVQPQPTTDQPTADTFPIVQPQPTTDQPTADTFPTVKPAEPSYIDKLLPILQYRAELFTQYVGHKARLCHEDARRAFNEQRCRENPDTMMVVADFAMKWLPYKYRETMNEWFGKKGKFFQ